MSSIFLLAVHVRLFSYFFWPFAFFSSKQFVKPRKRRNCYWTKNCHFQTMQERGKGKGITIEDTIQKWVRISKFFGCRGEERWRRYFLYIILGVCCRFFSSSWCLSCTSLRRPSFPIVSRPSRPLQKLYHFFERFSPLDAFRIHSWLWLRWIRNMWTKIIWA